jgi:hypothetical protein
LVVEKLIDMGETLGGTDPAGAELKTVVVAPALFSCERGVSLFHIMVRKLPHSRNPLSEIEKIISETVLRSVIFRRD